MQNIKVGCIPVRQVIGIDTKLSRIKTFIKQNKVGLVIGGVSMVLLSTYVVLIMKFINLIKIIY